MAVDERFRAVISADDQTSGAIRRIQMSLAGLGRQPGLARLGAITTRLTASITSLGRASASLAVPIGGLGAAAAVAAGAGLIGMVNATVEAGDGLNDLSNQLGISVEQIQELSYAAAQHGVAQEAMTGGLERLTRGMQDAATGGNKDLLALFRRMRIPLRNARGELRSAADVLPDLANAFQNTTNPALRTAAAMELFGRGGAPLVRLLSTGSEGLEELRQRFRQLSGAITTETVPRLDSAGDAMLEVRTALTGMRDAIVLQLTPALGPMLVELATFIGSNRELIAQRVERVFTSLADAIRRIDWNAVVMGVDSFTRNVMVAYAAVGEWRGILIGLGALLSAPFVAAGLTIIAQLGTIAAAMGAASPIGLAIIGIVGAAALIVSNWEAIGGFFSRLWDGIAAGWDRAWARMKPSFDVFAAIIRAIGDGIERLANLIPNIPAIEARTPEVREEQRRNMGQRGAASGFYAGPAEDPGPEEPDAIRRLPPPPPRVERPRRGGLRAPQESMVDPDTGRPVYAQPQSLRQPAAEPEPMPGAAPAPQRESLWTRPGGRERDGQVALNVRFENAPPGTRVATETRGDVVRNPTVAVGYARLGVA